MRSPARRPSSRLLGASDGPRRRGPFQPKFSCRLRMCSYTTTGKLPFCQWLCKSKHDFGASFFRIFCSKSPHFLSDYALLAPHFSSGCGALAPHFFTFWRRVLFFGIRQEGFGSCQPASEKVVFHFLSGYVILALHFLSGYAILAPHFVASYMVLAPHFVSSCVPRWCPRLSTELSQTYPKCPQPTLAVRS